MKEKADRYTRRYKQISTVNTGSGMSISERITYYNDGRWMRYYTVFSATRKGRSVYKFASKGRAK